MIVKIKFLNCNDYFLIDEEKLQEISIMSWSKTHYGYVEGYLGKQKFLLHRFLLGLPHKNDLVVDHINGDKKDNRICNLRICTQADNAKNNNSNRNALGYKGIHRHKNSNLKKPFIAEIKVNGKRLKLGYYETVEDAARAYDEAARKYHGEFANTNDHEHDLVNYELIHEVKILNTKAPRSSVGFFGVRTSNSRFRSSIRINGNQTLNIGTFDTAEEAARAYDKMARIYHGDKARLNFPDQESA